MTILFYKADGPYGCFSNFSPHPIRLQGRIWLTSEHYYQAHKYINSPHAALCEQIRQASSPEMAAALGRDPRYAVRLDWEAVKLQVMYTAVFTKFSSHPDIRAVLVGTEDEPIVEDSPSDSYWGWGADHQGHNYLGRLLMQVREQLRLAKPTEQGFHPEYLTSDRLAKPSQIVGWSPEPTNPKLHHSDSLGSS
ncbi:DUF1768 domain-containing protein [Synechococcales cyanobacterium C]|uniref:DUF1768 domain-containing protein n=1 Tax=Petrachloros mirabilis ULC683 TaxID=2781853 RepID=A0A8K2ANG0_9CYAN|nr:DUF1768 domain-containing protein [Petrachloros mirabilis ULC683]